MDDDYSNITYQICQLRLSISIIQHFVVATGPVVATGHLHTTVTLFYINKGRNIPTAPHFVDQSQQQ